MLQGGADSIYLTDKYSSAAHYAEIAARHKGEAGKGVVLGMYSDDIDNLGTLQPPKLNQRSIHEVVSGNQKLRAVRADSLAPQIDDFGEFWNARVGRDGLLVDQLRALLGEQWVQDAINTSDGAL